MPPSRCPTPNSMPLLPSRVLTMPAAERPATGDVAAGERFFAGKGNCSSATWCGAKAASSGPISPIWRGNEGRRRSRGACGNRRERLESRFLGSSARWPDPARRSLRYESPFDLGVQRLTLRFTRSRRTAVAASLREPSTVPRRRQTTPDEMRDLLAYLTRLYCRSFSARNAGWDGGGCTSASRFDDIARAEAWRVAHLSRPTERQSAQPARPDQHEERRRGSRRNGPSRCPRLSGALQVTPVVVDGLMYVTAVNAVCALDARTGRQIWQYSAAADAGRSSEIAASGINRGVAVLGDRVFLQTDHAHLLALASTDRTASVGRRDGGLSSELRRRPARRSSSTIW